MSVVNSWTGLVVFMLGFKLCELLSTVGSWLFKLLNLKKENLIGMKGINPARRVRYQTL